jgi:hypothetical protein
VEEAGLLSIVGDDDICNRVSFGTALSTVAIFFLIESLLIDVMVISLTDRTSNAANLIAHQCTSLTRGKYLIPVLAQERQPHQQGWSR